MDWEGFVFNWYIVPDELLLLKSGISLKQVNQYRGFLSSEIISTYISIDGINAGTDKNIIQEFKKCFDFPINELKNYFANFGKRTPSNDFLGIKGKYAISNLSWFRETHSASQWITAVTTCYNTAKKQAIEEFRKLNRIKALNDTLNREFCSVCAAAAYFGRDIDSIEKMRSNEVVLEAFSKPNIVLDSVCYVRMINL